MKTNPQDGLPPFIKSWPQMYALVIGFLVATMLFFYWLMQTFNT
jgi:hypothetical protein